MYRAVSTGRLTGIFCDIGDSKRYVEGYPNASHRIFECKEEAFRWMEYMKRCEIDKENARLRERFGEDCTEQEEWEKNVIEPYKADGDAESPRNIEGLNWQDSVELPPEQLSEDQKYILGLVLDGHNVFFTGPAGSGKSLLLKHIKYHLRKNKKRERR
ncbi:uncharacterized protein LAJ45_03225 [Morchella importuna]|uniref:uncharacterized protein n=1 Tax=Morchella importuna TaxID=1174673 RepID=UPI001E8E18A1|nr:uncharacterized protein LAJ45_03225 [Morchella importuna]KAH8152385.1 hypothetical protein LAJ45_03225 [Morchella importuna]